jgi:biotin carboxyl carrier protein
MTFEIEVNGELRTVSVEPAGNGAPAGSFRGRVEGDPVDVQLQPTDLGLSLLIGARTVDAALTELRPDEWLVQLPGVAVTAILNGRRSGHVGAAAVSATGEYRVTAPMPGRVVRVLVKPGDEVAPRQGLVVVEAMKMENELSSPRAGIVREVAVSEGASVEAGRLLAVID